MFNSEDIISSTMIPRKSNEILRNLKNYKKIYILAYHNIIK